MRVRVDALALFGGQIVGGWLRAAGKRAKSVCAVRRLDLIETFTCLPCSVKQFSGCLDGHDLSTSLPRLLVNALQR